MTGVRELARELGVHPSTVSRRIRAGKDPREQRPLAGVPRPSAAKPRYPDLPDQIAVRAAAGMGGHRIAADLGISRSATVYDVARREGIELPGRTRDAGSLRRAIEDMRPSDALEFVLEAYEQVAGVNANRQLDLMDKGLTGAQALIFMALEARERCTYDHLCRVVDHAQAGQTTEGCIKAQVCKLRRKIAGWPVRIETIWGVGYRLVRREQST